jgi:hypothetical protein
MRRALAIVEKSYGPEHPEVAIPLNNLASLLQDTSRLDEAEPLLRRALAIAEKSREPRYSKVALILENLAVLLQAENSLTEAEQMMRCVIIIVVEFYFDTGHEHPQFRTAIGYYTSLLSKMSKTDTEISATLKTLVLQAHARQDAGSDSCSIVLEKK